MMNVKLIGLLTSAVVAMGSMARADIVSNLEVHYAFESGQEIAYNSVGPDGHACGA